MEETQEVPSPVEQGGSHEPVLSMHTSSTNAIVSLSPLKVVVPPKELDVTFQGVDIDTGKTVDVKFTRKIIDPVIKTFVPPDIQIPKHFTHFAILSKHLKSRSNQWLLDDNKKDNDLV